MQSGHAWGFFLVKLRLAETCCESDPSFDAGRQRGSENAQAECRLEGGFNCPMSDKSRGRMYADVHMYIVLSQSRCLIYSHLLELSVLKNTLETNNTATNYITI